MADLAAHPATCTLAYWHQPRFSSGYPGQGSDTAYQWFWEDLYAFHADVVLNGHAHDYERFAPQTPSGQASESGDPRVHRGDRRSRTAAVRRARGEQRGATHAGRTAS